jgi:hypothetical protein
LSGWVLSVSGREHSRVDPISLPLSTVLSFDEKLKPVVLPDQMALGENVFIGEVDLVVEECTGAISVFSPREKKKTCDSTAVFKVWDKIQTEEKSQLVLKSSVGVEYRLGANSMIQLIKDSSGVLVLRLLKGRIRVINPKVQIIRVETLNTVSSISQGVTDIIISAMNTLVAPREGARSRVVSRKADREVSVGDYGLVMADGSLVFTRSKGGKS